MKNKNLEINIAHFYPKLLNLYGDFGNVVTLQKRCEWRGIKANIHSIEVGENFEPQAFDFYFLSGGQDNQQIVVSKELQKHKKALLDARDNNSVILGVCGGYQLLGHYYQPSENEEIAGLGLLDAYTIPSQKRFIGNVTADCEFLSPKTLVGFENHSGKTILQGETQPLATLSIGCGNNGEDNTEGARFKNVFGTYLHGAVLPKNVHFADYLISLALQNKYKDKIVLTALDDAFEVSAHNALVGKSY